MLGVMFTWTTYGSWLRGDARGWVDDGIVCPPNTVLRLADRNRMTHEPWQFAVDDLRRVGQMIGDSLALRTDARPLALTVQTWHVHLVTAVGNVECERIVKCAKDSVRWGLRPGRPIWTDGFDRRFCYEEASLQARIHYVERHNVAMGWPAKPWAFLDYSDID